MRETTTTVVLKCDANAMPDHGTCGKPAIGTYTVGVAMGEEVPALHVMDLCEQHAQRVHSLAESIEGLPLLQEEQVSSPPPPIIVQAPTRHRPKRHKCRICGNDYRTRANLIAHIWALHTAPGVQQPTPTTCPECGQQFRDGRQMALHRRMHGYNALETAYRAAGLVANHG